MKKLYRSNTDRIMYGVFGGLGEYLKISSSFLRLIYILITLGLIYFMGVLGFIVMFLLYFGAQLLIPMRPWGTNQTNAEKTFPDDGEIVGTAREVPADSTDDNKG